jgi:hypothetical protein
MVTHVVKKVFAVYGTRRFSTGSKETAVESCPGYTTPVHNLPSTCYWGVADHTL